MGTPSPAEAADDLQKARRLGNSIFIPQSAGGSREADTQSSARNLSVSASLQGYYDNWRNDSTPKEKGEQFTEVLSLGFDISRLFLPTDNLSIFVEGGTIQSKVARGGSSTNLKVQTDTTLIATYSTFDWKTWGLEGSLSVNLPTGKTELTELELVTVPNPYVTSRFLLGRGLDVGGSLKYLRQLGQLHLYTGAGYTRRGTYDVTKERSGDTISAGDEYNASLGGNYQFGTTLNVGADGSYIRSQGVGDQQVNIFMVRVPAKLSVGRLSVAGQYFASYSDTEPFKGATIIVRQEELFQKGLTNMANVEVAYQVLDSLRLKAVGEGSVNDLKKPADPTFFTSTSRYAFGPGVGWSIPGTPLTLDAVGKYFNVFTEGSTGSPVTFSGFSILVGVSGRF
ncbi:MAG: hypothetical protein Q7R68_01905 [Nitrospirales bacterium]|nr:hypothetical protein [Nitrospirales bacterium]